MQQQDIYSVLKFVLWCSTPEAPEEKNQSWFKVGLVWNQLKSQVVYLFCLRNMEWHLRPSQNCVKLLFGHWLSFHWQNFGLHSMTSSSGMRSLQIQWCELPASCLSPGGWVSSPCHQCLRWFWLDCLLRRGTCRLCMGHPEEKSRVGLWNFSQTGSPPNISHWCSMRPKRLFVWFKL